MRRQLIILCLLLISANSFAQFSVWQGFEVEWTYNHRLNRLGSYVYQDSVFTTSATGLGRDSGWFNTHYMLVPESGVQYNEIHLYKRIEAKEKEIIQIQIDTFMLVSNRHSIFFLNGFDIIANNDADKLQLMEFSVKPLKGNYDTTKIRIQASLIFNCQSLECDWINNDVDYDLHLYVGSLYFANEDYVSYASQDLISETNSWNRKSGITEYCTVTDHEIPQFITDLKISLNKAHWYTGIKACINEKNDPCMRFSQYRDKMKKNAWYKPHAAFSKKSKGTAMLQMRGLTLRKPVYDQMVHQTFSGSIIWMGRNKTAFSRDAVRSKSIEK